MPSFPIGTCFSPINSVFDNPSVKSANRVGVAAANDPPMLGRNRETSG